MSSLAASRADNFYYGPDYQAKHGSLNKFRGSHPLGDRAKKIHEGILVIRFEMPYKVFCNKCNEVIAKGVRFNAEKRTIGHYFSTKILEFSMKCCFCDNIFKIHTDPKNCEYIPYEGLRRKVETFEAKDAETIEFRSIDDLRDGTEQDPMLKLEATAEDLSRARQSHGQIESLMAFNESRNSSDVQYDLNLKVRKRFREQKKEGIAREIQRKKHCNFVVPLVSEDPKDIEEAKSINYVTHAGRVSRRIKQRVLEASSIFQPPKKERNEAPSTDPSSNKCKVIPCSAHPALSLLLPVKRKPLPLAPSESSQEKRSRLCGDIERIRSVRRSGVAASILEQRRRP